MLTLLRQCAAHMNIDPTVIISRFKYPRVVPVATAQHRVLPAHKEELNHAAENGIRQFVIGKQRGHLAVRFNYQVHQFLTLF